MITNERVSPLSHVHCPKCPWKGILADAATIKDGVCGCPKCGVPAVFGDRPAAEEAIPAQGGFGSTPPKGNWDVSWHGVDPAQFFNGQRHECPECQNGKLHVCPVNSIPRSGITRPGLTEMQEGVMQYVWAFGVGLLCGIPVGIVLAVVGGLGLAAWWRG